MQNIQAFLKFAGSLSPEQFTEFSTLIGFKVESDPRKPGFGTFVPTPSPEAGVGLTDACAGCGAPLFDLGDVVTLASGGPGMTIAVIDDTHATVMWFDDDDDLCERRVPLAVLEHAPSVDTDEYAPSVDTDE